MLYGKDNVCVEIRRDNRYLLSRSSRNFHSLPNVTKPQVPTYLDNSGRIIGQSELERRGNYMWKVKRQFQGEGRPLVQMIQRCLKNRMRERPNNQQVMGWLEEARAKVEDGEYDMKKLSLAQMLQSRNFHIQQQQQENHRLRENIQQQQRENHRNIQQQHPENHSLREQNDVQKQQIDVQNALIASLEEQLQLLRTDSAEMKGLLKFLFHHYTVSPSLSPDHTYYRCSQTYHLRS